MVAGRPIWIAIWYGILLLGVLGLWASIYWGRQTHWKNLDELVRSFGTICAAVGMLLLLNGVGGGAAETLLVIALLGFVIAFVLSRRRTRAAQAAREADSGEPRKPDGPPPERGA